MDEINAQLQQALPGNGQLIIWGTGQLTMKLLCESMLADREVVAFVDNNPIGKEVESFAEYECSPPAASGERTAATHYHRFVAAWPRDHRCGIRANYQLDNQLVELDAGSEEGLRPNIATSKRNHDRGLARSTNPAGSLHASTILPQTAESNERGAFRREA